MCVEYTPVHVELSMSTVDDTENLITNLVFLGQYLTSVVIEGLYVHIGDIPDVTRPFLVDITPSRVVFSAILVPRGVCDNSKMCVRARSLVRRLLSQTRV